MGKYRQWRFFMLLFFIGESLFSWGQTPYDHFEQGNRFYESGDFQRALYEYEQGLQTDSTSNPYFFVLAGTSAEKSGEYNKAIQLYKQAKGHGVSEDIDYRIYLVYLQIKQFDQAEQILQQALYTQPNKTELYTRRLLAHYEQMQEKEKAVQTIEKLLSLNPKDSTLLEHDLAYLQHKLGKDSLAMLHYQKWINEHPNDTEAILFLGCYHWVKARNQLKRIDDSIKSSPKTMSYLKYGTLQAMRKEVCDTHLAPALSYFNRINELTPSNEIENSIIKIHQLLNPKEKRPKSHETAYKAEEKDKGFVKKKKARAKSKN